MSEKNGFVIDFGRYYDYEELTDILKRLAEVYPDLTTLHSIGKSCRDRDIWLLEVTNKESGGEPGTKPGYYIDAVTHPEEISGA